MNHAELYYQDSDAKNFETEALLMNTLLLIALVFYSVDALPLLLLMLLVSIFITRWMISIHELFHISFGENVSLFTRLILIPFTPFNLGYDEYRAVHMRHHKSNAGSEDPEAYHIRQNHFKSLLVSMTYPEQSFFRYIKSQQLSNHQWKHVLIRLLLFLSLLIIFQMDFIIYWLVLRVCYGINIWTFFHCLHNKNGEYGTYPVNLPYTVKQVYKWLYGKHSLEATLHHDVHHQWPRVAYWNLSKLQTEKSL